MKQNKKAAIELSIGTIVIIVLAMSMLILGLVLVRNIFTGATSSVDEINEGVKSEIKKLFQDESDKAVVRLSGSEAVIKQGEEFGFAFGVKNVASSGTQTYKYEASATAVDPTCSGLTIEDAEGWIIFGSGDMTADAGKIDQKIIRLKIPEDAPTCSAQFKIEILKTGDTTPYETLQFFVKVKSSGVF